MSYFSSHDVIMREMLIIPSWTYGFGVSQGSGQGRWRGSVTTLWESEHSSATHSLLLLPATSTQEDTAQAQGCWCYTHFLVPPGTQSSFGKIYLCFMVMDLVTEHEGKVRWRLAGSFDASGLTEIIKWEEGRLIFKIRMNKSQLISQKFCIDNWNTESSIHMIYSWLVHTSNVFLLDLVHA